LGKLGDNKLFDKLDLPKCLYLGRLFDVVIKKLYFRVIKEEKLLLTSQIENFIISKTYSLNKYSK